MIWIWMPESAEGAWAWRIDGDWMFVASLQQLIDTVQLHSKQKQAIVFFPSSRAQFYQQPLAKASYRQLGVAGCQYLIEDVLVEPIEQMSVHLHHQQNHLYMMAISKFELENYQQLLAVLPWKVTAYLPDFLVLPEPKDNQCIYLQFQHRSIWRDAAYSAYVAEDLETLVQFYPELEKVQVIVDDTEFAQQQLQYLHKHYTVEEVPDNTWQLDPKWRQHAFNALPKAKSNDSSVSVYWKACAMVLVTALALQNIYNGLRWRHYHQINQQIEMQTLQQYQQWFPNERVSVSQAAINFDAHLAKSKSVDLDALNLLSRVGPVLQQQNMKASEVIYSDQQLSMMLLAANNTALDGMVAQLKQIGLAAELGNVTTQGSQVLGQVQVK